MSQRTTGQERSNDESGKTARWHEGRCENWRETAKLLRRERGRGRRPSKGVDAQASKEWLLSTPLAQVWATASTTLIPFLLRKKKIDLASDAVTLLFCIHSPGTIA